jgi:hypothetical protein
VSGNEKVAGTVKTECLASFGFFTRQAKKRWQEPLRQNVLYSAFSLAGCQKLPAAGTGNDDACPLAFCRKNGKIFLGNLTKRASG